MHVEQAIINITQLSRDDVIKMYISKNDRHNRQDASLYHIFKQQGPTKNRVGMHLVYYRIVGNFRGRKFRG